MIPPAPTDRRGNRRIVRHFWAQRAHSGPCRFFDRAVLPRCRVAVGQLLAGRRSPDPLSPPATMIPAASEASRTDQPVRGLVWPATLDSLGNFEHSCARSSPTFPSNLFVEELSD
jgi:hypothetical protein